MSNWFVFHVQTGREQTACDFLNKLFDGEESFAFIPQVEISFKNSKFLRKELKPMFPGYVITDSTLDENIFATEIYKYVRFSKCIFDLLGNGELCHMKLTDNEKNFLLGFCNGEYVAEESKGFIVGEKVYVTSGPLQGRESIIRRIDRHKRRAEIEVIYFGELKRITVAIEIVAKL